MNAAILDDEDQRAPLLKTFAQMRGDMVDRADRAVGEGARSVIGADSSPDDIRAAFRHATLIEPQPIASAVQAEVVVADHRWLVASFLPRLHEKVTKGCADVGWVFYCPKAKTWRDVKNPKKGQPRRLAVEKSLFGTYGFLRPADIDAPDWLSLDRVDGLGNYLRRPITREPVSVPRGEVEKVIKAEAEGEYDETRSRPPKVKPTDVVTIKAGPFAGISGLVEMTTGERVKVLLDMLGAIDLSMDDVEAV